MRAILALFLGFFQIGNLGPTQRGQIVPTTYTATKTFTLPTGSALNDFWLIQGSATKTVYWTSMEKQCATGTSATNWINVMVRRTSETGGTFTAWTAVPHDPNSPAATATVGDYSAGLTTGNSGGSVFMQRYNERLPVNSSGTFIDIVRDHWGMGVGRETHFGESTISYSAQQSGLSGIRPVKPLVLRGTSDILALTTSAAPANAIQCTITVQWYEQ